MLRAGIGDAPLADLLADDQGPFGLRRQGEQCVSARRNILAANHYIHSGDKRSRVVGTRAPHFSKRNQVAENPSPAHARTGLVRGTGLAVRKVASRLGARCYKLGSTRKYASRRSREKNAEK